eukprot:UN27817
MFFKLFFVSFNSFSSLRNSLYSFTFTLRCFGLLQSRFNLTFFFISLKHRIVVLIIYVYLFSPLLGLVVFVQSNKRFSL